MASDNLMWPIRSAFSDAWISDIFTRDNDAMARALQMPFSVDSGSAAVFSAAEPLIVTPVQTPTASGGSEKEFVKQRRGGGGVPPSGRIAKRKSARASSKRTNTTFVAVDPENFRQMVQQVTGVKFCGGVGGGEIAPAAVVVKPEAQRGAIWGIHHQGSVLDTSSFFLDGGFGSTSSGVDVDTDVPPPATAPAPFASSSGVLPAPAAIDFDPFSFPTLESWKVIS